MEDIVYEATLLTDTMTHAKMTGCVTNEEVSFEHSVGSTARNPQEALNQIDETWLVVPDGLHQKKQETCRSGNDHACGSDIGTNAFRLLDFVYDRAGTLL